MDTSKKVMLISKEPSFVFIITTIVEQLELTLLSLDNKNNITDEILEKQPFMIVWDTDDNSAYKTINNKFFRFLPRDCHLLLFSHNIEKLKHIKNGRVHLFEKPFSPNEISKVIKEIST
jgi:hypothetical protein